MRQSLKISLSNTIPEAGCDESGRGCLAGPVFAAAVVLPQKPDMQLFCLLNDSKKLSAKAREKCSEIIREHAVSVSLAKVDASFIDEINILNASILAMQQALEELQPQPAFILIDGNRFIPFNSIPYRCIVGGDAQYLSIAAASIIAKTARDAYMKTIHDEYPVYGWDKNKGYPTPAHREAIARHGLSPYHRLSFRQYPQLKLQLENEK